MPRLVLGLILGAIASLLATFVLGFLGADGGDLDSLFSRLMYWHMQMGNAVVILITIINTAVPILLVLDHNRIIKTVEAKQLPEWFMGLSTRNKNRVVPFLQMGFLLMGAAWVSGILLFRGLLAADFESHGVLMWPHRAFSPLWHLGIVAVAFGFHLGVFGVEYLALVAQNHLLSEVEKGLVDLSSGPSEESECRRS